MDDVYLYNSEDKPQDCEVKSYLKSAAEKNTILTTSFSCGKLLQQTSTPPHNTHDGTDSEHGRLSDCQKQTSYLRHIPKTSLSPHVSYLLTRSVPRSGLATLPNILLDDCTLEWSTLPALITTKEDFVVGVMNLGVIAERVSTKLHSLNMETQLKGLPEAFSWTASPELFVHCVQHLLVSDPSANILSSLLCCAGLERALGDVYLSVSKADQCPSLLRDLLVAKELEDIFGTTVVCLLRCLMGHPLGLNLRNLLWHGFVAPSELPKEYAYMLPVLAASLGNRLKKGSTGSGEEAVNLCHTSPCRLRHKPYLSLNGDAITPVFPVVTESELDAVRDLFSHSFFILPSMLPIWLAAVKAVQEKRSGDALALLLPSLEHSLRRVFAHVNGCPERAITAEATVLYTTFDEILSPLLPDGSSNHLKEEIGVNKLEMLLDLMVHPEGPKLRAKISHGEVDFGSVPQVFANHVLCVAVVFCAQYTLQTELTRSTTTIVTRCLSIEKQYVSLFHPISLLKKELLQLVTNLEQWKDIPTSPDESSTIDQLDSSYDAIRCVLHIAPSLRDTLKLDGACLQCQLEKCLDLQTPPPSPLQNLITRVWQRSLNTLYVPRPDLELVGLVRSIVTNANQSVSQVTKTAEERYAQLRRMELRARQRSNYDRLTSSVVTYHQAMVVVIMLVCASLLRLPLDPGFAIRHNRFLKKVLQFSENFKSRTSPARNRWTEATAQCHMLFTLALECHMTRSHEGAGHDKCL